MDTYVIYVRENGRTGNIPMQKCLYKWHIVTKYPAGFLFIEISGLSVFICIFVVFKRRIVDRILLCGSLSWQDHGQSFVVFPFSF